MNQRDPYEPRHAVGVGLEVKHALDALHDPYNCTVFGDGGFNCWADSDPLGILRQKGYASAQDVADNASPASSHNGDPRRGDDGKYHGSPKPEKNEKRYSIDHLIVPSEHVHVHRLQVVLDQNALDASDHSPLYMDITASLWRFSPDPHRDGESLGFWKADRNFPRWRKVAVPSCFEAA